MSSKPARGIGARRLQQDVVGLVAAEHVVDEVGRDRHLPAGLFLARMPALDQPGDDGAIAERALQQVRIREPRLEIVAQHVLVEEIGERRRPCVEQRAHDRASPRSASE